MEATWASRRSRASLTVCSVLVSRAAASCELERPSLICCRSLRVLSSCCLSSSVSALASVRSLAVASRPACSPGGLCLHVPQGEDAVTAFQISAGALCDPRKIVA